MTDHADAWILAIDFGTTNTAAAIRSGGRNDILELLNGSRTMPSAVILDTGNGPCVGDQAVRRRALHPHTYEENPKSLVGMPPKMYDGRPIHAEKFVAEIFREVRRIALDRKAGVEPAKVVLTHPSAWGGLQTQPLRRAAESAGFHPRTIELVEEPIAAAHYFRHESDGQPIPVGGQVLVFDFGGGTLDLALVEHTEDGEFEVKDVEAIENLGGNNLDEALWDWTLAQIEARHPEAIARLRSPQGRREEATLRDQVRKAKEELSIRPATDIPVVIGDDYDDAYRPTAEEYEALIRPLVERAVTLTRTLLDRNDHSKVVKFYLTGGSSLTPLVARELSHATGLTPTRLGDPKTVVVDGALSAVAAATAVPKQTNGPDPEDKIYGPPKPTQAPPTPVPVPDPDQSTDKTDGPPNPAPVPPTPDQSTKESDGPPNPTPVPPTPDLDLPAEKTDEAIPPSLVPQTPHVKRNLMLSAVIWALIGAALLWVGGVVLFISIQVNVASGTDTTNGFITAYVLQGGAMGALLAHHLTRPVAKGRVAAYIYAVLMVISLVMASPTNSYSLYASLNWMFGGCLVLIGAWLLIAARRKTDRYIRSLQAPAPWVIAAGAVQIWSMTLNYIAYESLDPFDYSNTGAFLSQWVSPATILGIGAGYVISGLRLKRELEKNAVIALPNVNDDIDTPRA